MTLSSNRKPKQKRSQLFTTSISSFAKEALKLCRTQLIFLKKVKFRDHVFYEQGIQRVAKRVKDLQNLKPPESKKDVIKILGCFGYYSCRIKNLHVDSQPFYKLIKDTTPFEWTNQHEELFKEIKTRISDDTTLAVPSTECSFHTHVESSNGGTGCILVQQYPGGNRKVSFNCSIPAFPITLNRKCQPSTVNYAG